MAHYLDKFETAEALELATKVLPTFPLNDAAFTEALALAVGWLRYESGQYGAAIKAADKCERSATTRQDAIAARLLWADATLFAAPHSPDAALAALDKLAPIQVDGLDAALAAWHWHISARAFRRLHQADAELEATQQAGRFLAAAEPSGSALLRRVRRWLQGAAELAVRDL